jgi:hypothetical protein
VSIPGMLSSGRGNSIRGKEEIDDDFRYHHLCPDSDDQGFGDPPPQAEIAETQGRLKPGPDSLAVYMTAA